MAQYHAKIDKIKDLIEDAKFSPEQLNVVRKMILSTVTIRQSKVLNDAFVYMVPKGFVIENITEEGKYGSYTVPVVKVEEGS